MVSVIVEIIFRECSVLSGADTFHEASDPSCLG